MRRSLLFLLALALLPIGEARVIAEETSLAGLEGQLSRLDGHRVRLEAFLAEQGKRIARLKAQAPGVARDFQLRSTLKENQELASRLTKLQQDLRVAAESLLVTYDKAIAESSDPARRDRLEAARAALRSRTAAGAGSRIVTGERAGRLDSAEDLDEKADLLEDSRLKVARQLERITRAITKLENRDRILRHGRAAEDNPFVEDSPRRTSRALRSTDRLSSVATGTGGTNGATAPGPSPSVTTKTTGEADSKSSFDSSASMTPSGAKSGATSGGGAASASAGGTASTGRGEGTATIESVTVAVKEVLDPGLLKELSRSAKGDDLRAQLAALKKARGELAKIEGSLGAQARSLRQRSKAVKGEK
jgi:hypothetical protein